MIFGLSIGSAVLLAALWIAIRAGGAIVGAEVLGWLPVVSARVIRTAASLVPESEQERTLEEAEADLEQFEGRPLAQLAFAIQFALSVGKLRRELRRLLPARESVPAPSEPGWRSRMPAGAAAVIVALSAVAQSTLRRTKAGAARGGNFGGQILRQLDRGFELNPRSLLLTVGLNLGIATVLATLEMFGVAGSPIVSVMGAVAGCLTVFALFKRS